MARQDLVQRFSSQFAEVDPFVSLRLVYPSCCGIMHAVKGWCVYVRLLRGSGRVGLLRGVAEWVKGGVSDCEGLWSTGGCPVTAFYHIANGR